MNTEPPSFSRVAPLKELQHHLLLQALIDNLPDFIYIKDLESRFVIANQAVATCLGAGSPDELVGKSDLDFIALEKAQVFRRDEQAIIASGKPLLGHEEIVPFPDGTEFWYSTTKIPLRNPAGEVIAIVGIGRDITERKLAEDTVKEQAEELRRRNEEMERDLKLAQEFQRAMLPRRSMHFGSDRDHGMALDVEYRFIPQSGVSGDFLAVRKLPRNRLGILLCDAIGHGVRAALITAILEGILEDVALEDEGPAQSLQVFNTQLREVFRRQEGGLFVTALYAVVDLEGGTLSYARAGHHEPVRMKGATGRVEGMNLTKPGAALALLPNPAYTAGSCALQPGERYLFSSDGILEVRDPADEEYGERRLSEFLEKARTNSLSELCDSLIEDARAFSGREGFPDDISIVFLECSGPSTRGAFAGQPVLDS